MTAAVPVQTALTAVMATVQSVSKDRRVSEGPARFAFRGVDDVMSAVGPALREHGVVFAPTRIVSVEHERYETSRGTAMDGVTIVVEYTITGPAGDTMTAAAAGQAADSGDKAVPKALSVAYRTVLLQALCIPTGDAEPDSQVHERSRAVPPRPRGEVVAELPDPTKTVDDWSTTDPTVNIEEWRTLIGQCTTLAELKDVGASIAQLGLSKIHKGELRNAWNDKQVKLEAGDDG
jgi:hypothetical protein